MNYKKQLSTLALIITTTLCYAAEKPALAMSDETIQQIITASCQQYPEIAPLMPAFTARAQTLLTEASKHDDIVALVQEGTAFKDKVFRIMFEHPELLQQAKTMSRECAIETSAAYAASLRNNSTSSTCNQCKKNDTDLGLAKAQVTLLRKALAKLNPNHPSILASDAIAEEMSTSSSSSTTLSTPLPIPSSLESDSKESQSSTK